MGQDGEGGTGTFCMEWECPGGGVWEFGAVEGQRKRREGVCCHERVGRGEAGLVLHLSG